MVLGVCPVQNYCSVLDCDRPRVFYTGLFHIPAITQHNTIPFNTKFQPILYNYVACFKFQNLRKSEIYKSRLNTTAHFRGKEWIAIEV